MNCDVQSTGAIEGYFYDELAPGMRAEVRAHLRQCVECRQALEDLAVIRAALASRPDVSTPPGGDWSGFTARLDAAVRAAGERGQRADTYGRPARVLALPTRGRMVAYLAMAALLALVTLSVLVALRQRGRAETGPALADQVEGRPTGVDIEPTDRATPARVDPALVALSGQHFERSKLVVLGLATRDASTSDLDSWAYERDLAATLLDDNRLYRRAAEAGGMNTLAGVMQDLELVLLQTSMSQESDTASLEQLQRLIRRRDLLTKMNAVQAGGL
ncbi:MAG: anti-sigma factor family protein [Vicinamibacterales bacterium]